MLQKSKVVMRIQIISWGDHSIPSFWLIFDAQNQIAHPDTKSSANSISRICTCSTSCKRQRTQWLTNLEYIALKNWSFHFSRRVAGERLKFSLIGSTFSSRCVDSNGVFFGGRWWWNPFRLRRRMDCDCQGSARVANRSTWVSCRSTWCKDAKVQKIWFSWDAQP